MPISDLALTLVLIFAFIGGVVALGGVLHFAFDRLGRILRRIKELAVGKSGPAPLPQEIVSPADPPFTRLVTTPSADEAAHLARMNAFGISMEIGEEVRMGWYETNFTLAHPIAGVREVFMIEGRASFTDGNRCVVISDGRLLLILDRLMDHGFRLQLSKGWFESSVDGSVVRIRYHPRHGSKDVESVFTFQAHQDKEDVFVLDGWPGTAVMLPSPAGDFPPVSQAAS